MTTKREERLEKLKYYRCTVKHVYEDSELEVAFRTARMLEDHNYAAGRNRVLGPVRCKYCGKIHVATLSQHSGWASHANRRECYEEWRNRVYRGAEKRSGISYSRLYLNTAT